MKIKKTIKMKKIILRILLIVFVATTSGITFAQQDTTNYNDGNTYRTVIITDTTNNDGAVLYDVDEDLDDTAIIDNRDTVPYSKNDKDTVKQQENQKDSLQKPPERGLYIGLGLGIGATDFHYKLLPPDGGGKGAGHRMRLGGQVAVNAAYYFTRHWGISLGLGVSLYRSMGQYKGLNSGNFFDLGNQLIYDARPGHTDTEATIRARLLNWHELESSYFIDIPLMIQYQTKWKKGKNGMYFGLGVKYQAPFSAKYKVIDSDYSSEKNDDPDAWRLNISAYGKAWGDLGAPFYNKDDNQWHNGVEVVEHGIGTISNPNEALGWNGKMSIKGSWTGVAEVGFLFGLTRRIDLTLGAYFEYGFNNIEKGDDKALMTANPDYFNQFVNDVPAGQINSNPVGQGIDYAGLINSTQTKKTNLMAIGGKIGLRIKIGKLHCKDPWEEEPEIIDSVPEKKAEDPLKKLEDLLNDLLDNQNQPSTLIIKDGPNNPNDPNNPKRVVGSDNPDGLTPIEIAALECCIYFDYAKHDIRPSEIWCLEQKLAILRAHPEISMRILGNTCDMYGDDINVALGQRRAQAAKDWLVQRGISPARLIPITQSKYNPQVANDSEAHRKLNRRDDFQVITY
jgi:outer membrane protein OmpA-like peptidoglycan-associated protein